MLDSNVLNETLKKKNKEIEILMGKNEEMKKEYDMKTKNLMGSIATLQKQNRDLENQSKDNYRVEIIKSLKQERKDQELVINLLRRYIANELEVDKYLLKEFKKSGEMHLATYEELKILNKELQSKLTLCKLRLSENKQSHPSSSLEVNNKTKKGTTTTFNNTKTKTKTNMGIDDPMTKQKIMQLEEENNKLQQENESLKESKEKMEAMQSELFNKLKTYNKEIGEMKSIYDVIRSDLEEDNASKVAGLEAKVNRMQKENGKYIEKINELIKIGSEREKESLKKIKQLQCDNEVMSKLLETKKSEIEVYNEELNKYKNQLDNFDTKDVSRQRRNEEEKVNIIKKKNELEEEITYLGTVIKQKDIQIINLQKNIESMNDILEEKDLEIRVYNEKIKELEDIKTNSNYK